MKQTILLMFAILFVVSFVSAAQVGVGLNDTSNSTIRITINNPSATFEVNKSDVISYYIEFENKNSFPLDINVDSNAENLQFTNHMNLHLLPGDTIRTTYNITAVKSEEVQVSAQFAGNGKTFGATQRITIRLLNDKIEPNLYLIIGIPAILIIAAIIIFFVWRSFKKKNKTDHLLDRSGIKDVSPVDAVTHIE